MPVWSMVDGVLKKARQAQADVVGWYSDQCGGELWQRQYALPQARTILLQWLQLPDGDRVGAEQALRSVQ